MHTVMPILCTLTVFIWIPEISIVIRKLYCCSLQCLFFYIIVVFLLLLYVCIDKIWMQNLLTSPFVYWRWHVTLCVIISSLCNNLCLSNRKWLHIMHMKTKLYKIYYSQNSSIDHCYFILLFHSNCPFATIFLSDPKG